MYVIVYLSMFMCQIIIHFYWFLTWFF